MCDYISICFTNPQLFRPKNSIACGGWLPKDIYFVIFRGYEYGPWQKGIKVVDAMRTANQMTMRYKHYPELSVHTQFNHESSKQDVKVWMKEGSVSWREAEQWHVSSILSCFWVCRYICLWLDYLPLVPITLSFYLPLETGKASSLLVTLNEIIPRSLKKTFLICKTVSHLKDIYISKGQRKNFYSL